MLNTVTPIILTYDEAPNIGRVLDRLAWAVRVVIVDSGSADGTLQILTRYQQAEVFHRPFDSHTAQWNFGLDQVHTDWALTLDADYVLEQSFPGTIAQAVQAGVAEGYYARFRYCIGGRPLRGTLYPPRLLLFRRDAGRYVQDGHTQLLELRGRTAILDGYILHDDRKPLARWIRSQTRYAELEAGKLLTTPPAQLGRVDRLRRRGWLVPFFTPVYCLLAKGLLFDGRLGLYYTFQRTYAELLLALILMGRRLAAPTVGQRAPLETIRPGPAPSPPRTWANPDS